MTRNEPFALFDTHHEPVIGPLKVMKILVVGTTRLFVTGATVLPARMVTEPAEDAPVESVLSQPPAASGPVGNGGVNL